MNAKTAEKKNFKEFLDCLSEQELEERLFHSINLSMMYLEGLIGTERISEIVREKYLIKEEIIEKIGENKKESL